MGDRLRPGKAENGEQKFPGFHFQLCFWSDLLLILLVIPFMAMATVLLCAGVALGRWLGLLDEEDGL